MDLKYLGVYRKRVRYRSISSCGCRRKRKFWKRYHSNFTNKSEQSIH